ncbi:MAG: hypothetical protein ACE5DX_05825 [Candidatus Dojkabacteria bacterium]
MANYDVVFMLEAKTKKGYMPIGSISGINSGPFLILGDTTWFYWASQRNIYESTVNFFNEIRKTVLALFYANLANKSFYEHIAKHGIIRRVGTIYNLYEKEPAALFQTRN